MDKRSKIMIYVLIAILVGLFFVESSRPKPVNWRPSYTSGDKVPLGAHVLYDNLKHFFPKSEVSVVDQVPLDFLRAHEKETNANYIFINDYLVFDEVETDYLLDFAARGNKVFISSSSAYGALADTLKLYTNTSSYYYGGDQDTIRTRLVNKKLKDRSYVYHRAGSYRYFEEYDTLRTKVLGEILAFNPTDGVIESMMDFDDDETDEIFFEEDSSEVIDNKRLDLLTRLTPQVNFVEVEVGDGAIYYNLNPIAYSNYYLLNGKEQYVAESLAYLNSGPVYFDDYGKSGRKIVTSPMRFILSQASLAWAYYIAVAAILLYMIFVSKREQRIVPVIKPLENATVEFTRTIGNLYYQSADYTSIVDKKITFFLERVRSTYYLSTESLNESFIKKLAAKSGKSLEKTAHLIQLINNLRSKPFHNEQELKQLNQTIEDFLKEKK